MAKVLLSIPEKFLNQIDEFANQEQRTRSELIREALRSYMRKSVMFDAKKVNAQAELLDKLLDWFCFTIAERLFSHIGQVEFKSKEWATLRLHSNKREVATPD